VKGLDLAEMSTLEPRDVRRVVDELEHRVGGGAAIV